MSPVKGEMFSFCYRVSILVVGPKKTPVHELMDTKMLMGSFSENESDLFVKLTT
jgi:hypothetical protein